MKRITYPIHHRHRIITAFIISLLLSTKLSALGIGEMKLLSNLGEPLNARLHLTNTDDLSDAEIIIEQASTTMYKKLGVERSNAYYDLRFTIKEDRSVVVSTRDPIKEPYLDFILVFRWPEGELYKEFKLLIDPND